MPCHQSMRLRSICFVSMFLTITSCNPETPLFYHHKPKFPHDLEHDTVAGTFPVHTCGACVVVTMPSLGDLDKLSPTWNAGRLDARALATELAYCSVLTYYSSVQCLSSIRSNCDSSIGSRLNMFLKPLLKRWPNGLESVLDLLEWFWFSLSDHVLRLRLRDGVRSRRDMVPGKAGGAGADMGGEAV